MSFSQSQLSDLRLILDSNLSQRRLRHDEFIKAIAAAPRLNDPLLAVMSGRVSKTDDRFIYDLGAFHCSWSDTISFTGPRQFINPLGGYLDLDKHLDWVFGADYAEVTYRIVCGNYDPEKCEFAVTDFDDGEDAMVAVIWPCSGPWPQQAYLDSEYVARHGDAKIFIRGLPLQCGGYGADYWVISKQSLGPKCLEEIEEHRRILQKIAKENWQKYEAGKLYYRQRMQEYIAQRPWLQRQFHMEFIWGENAMAYTAPTVREPEIMEYYQEGLDGLIEDLKLIQTTLGGGGVIG